jgi:hypothetical protein
MEVFELFLEKTPLNKKKEKTLVSGLEVRVHPASNPRSNRALIHLLDHLNASETSYPGTKLTLIFSLIGAPVSSG